MSSKLVVHNRVAPQGAPVPIDESSFIDIPEEYNEDLVNIERLSSELNDARHELGRLMQIVNHLINVCDSADRGLTQAKKGIIEGLNLGEGNWAIDLDRKQVGLVLPVQKEVPRVV